MSDAARSRYAVARKRVPQLQAPPTLAFDYFHVRDDESRARRLHRVREFAPEMMPSPPMFRVRCRRCTGREMPICNFAPRSHECRSLMRRAVPP